MRLYRDSCLTLSPNLNSAVAEMTRVTRTGGLVAVYLWDYADRMQMIRHFFDAAVALDPNASELDEGRRFPICQPDALSQLFESAGLNNVEVRPIEVSTHFRNFDDYWLPFLGGQGPAPSYLMSLSDERRAALREQVACRVAICLGWFDPSGCTGMGSPWFTLILGTI